jgi:hypothetical protein
MCAVPYPTVCEPSAHGRGSTCRERCQYCLSHSVYNWKRSQRPLRKAGTSHVPIYLVLQAHEADRVFDRWVRAAKHKGRWKAFASQSMHVVIVQHLPPQRSRKKMDVDIAMRSNLLEDTFGSEQQSERRYVLFVQECRRKRRRRWPF